ncbi:sensor domain-containing diguanylate cyclase [Bacillus sp. Gen3]|nr:sensor domain-containing diguanylate cyclase [Bacillus sp. Gen3]
MKTEKQNNEDQQILGMISKLLNVFISNEGNLLEDIKELTAKPQYQTPMVQTIFNQLQTIHKQIENMHWMNKNYKILHEFAQICSKTLDVTVLLKKAYEMVSQVMPTDSFYIALYNEGETNIQFTFVVDGGEIAPSFQTEYGENFTSKVIRTREIIHLKGSNQSLEFETRYGEVEKDTNSCLFVPLIIDDHVKGVISAQSYADFAYRKEHEELLQIIGTQVINSIETANLYEKIYTISQTDELTGLKNHRAFHNDLSNLINEGTRELTLVMLDSDNLKQVNDQYGHDIGDLYLKSLANGIKSISGEGIEGYRYAGDEFMVIIQSNDRDDLEGMFDSLKEYLSLHPIYIGQVKITVSISSGVATYPLHGLTVDSLKKSADQALYTAKQSGKNLIVLAN